MEMFHKSILSSTVATGHLLTFLNVAYVIDGLNFFKKYLFFRSSWTQYLYFVYLCLCDAEDWTQSLAHARPWLYHGATIPAPGLNFMQF